jgi:hypothetical protein
MLSLFQILEYAASWGVNEKNLVAGLYCHVDHALRGSVELLMPLPNKSLVGTDPAGRIAE